MRVLALAKAYYPDIEANKLMGGFLEYNLDGSKFDGKSFQSIDRETRHAATTICSTIRLDSYQPAFDAKGRIIASEDPEPYIVDVPRVPKDKGAEVFGSGTPAIAAPSRPEIDDEDLPFDAPLSSICCDTKPVTVGLTKKKSAKVVQIQEPGEEQGSPSKRMEAASAPSTTADPATAPGPN